VTADRFDPLGQSPMLAEVGDRLLHEQGKCCGSGCTVCGNELPNAISEMLAAEEPSSDFGRKSRAATLDRLLTAREVAELLGFAAGTIVDWAEQGRIPHFKIGQALRFRESEVVEWLEARRRGPALAARPRAGV
jgi:excisionase family DNA binding protein